MIIKIQIHGRSLCMGITSLYLSPYLGNNLGIVVDTRISKPVPQVRSVQCQPWFEVASALLLTTGYQNECLRSCLDLFSANYSLEAASIMWLTSQYQTNSLGASRIDEYKKSLLRVQQRGHCGRHRIRNLCLGSYQDATSVKPMHWG